MLACFRKQPPHYFRPAGENRLHIFFDLQPVRYRPEDSKRQQVLHLVGNARPISLGSEAMLMMPPFVRTLPLHVNKMMRRFPLNNFCRPTNRENQRNEYLISVPLRTGAGFDAQNAKVEQRGSEFLQIFRLREEFEDLIQRLRDELLGAKSERSHLNYFRFT